MYKKFYNLKNSRYNLIKEIPFEIQEKINNKQKHISTNYDLSGLGYYKDGLIHNISYWSEKNNTYKRILEYSRSDKGKINLKKYSAKRNRKLGFIPINNYFDNSHAHHVNTQYVIYIPKETHRMIYHSVLKDINMIEINSLAFTWLESTI